jgi:hypothetical protein
VTKPWKPRCSSLGQYSSCLWRAANDRMVAEGVLPAPPPQADTSNASLGTCGHFTLQDGLRCEFPRKRLDVDPVNFSFKLEDLERAKKPLDATNLTPVELELLTLADEHFEGDVCAAHDALAVGDPRCYQPAKAEWEDAAKLWNGNLDHTREQVRAAASLAAARLPPLPKGEVWLAEEEFENEYTVGHTDFRRRDNSVLGDLKTTGKPPQGGWIKPAHLMQLTGYHLLTGAPRAWCLYVDSMKSRWVNVVWIDFTTDAMKFYAEQVESFCRFLMSDKLFDAAYPNLGEHCVYSWCKYRSECYSRIMPPPGSLYNLSIARKATGPIRLTAI